MYSTYCTIKKSSYLYFKDDIYVDQCLLIVVSFLLWLSLLKQYVSVCLCFGICGFVRFGVLKMSSSSSVFFCKFLFLSRYQCWN